MKPTLVVLAAGMGSRFGGIKQIRPFGPHGELILDYTLYDACKAGFGKIVFVIKREMERDFTALLSGNFYAAKLQTELVFQEADDLPAPFAPPAGRLKPWGTGHALYAARNAVSSPFGVVGADDFFGRDTFSSLAGFLTARVSDKNACMVGFRLESTVTENGSVSRGVCEVQNGRLLSVTEHTRISLCEIGAVSTLDDGSLIPLSRSAVVSMNVWGFPSSVFSAMAPDFALWLSENISEPKKEYYLPAFADRRIKSGALSCEVLPTASRWYGVTYGEDAEILSAALSEMHRRGEYPALRRSLKPA